MTPTIRKNRWLIIASALMLVCASGILLYKNYHTTGSNDMLPVVLRSIRVNQGWGYEVLIDNKVYIHQDCIPAIPSFKAFHSERDALLVGNMVVDKIKHGHKPTITVQDLHTTRIAY